jgi:hypothetical protein
MFQRRCSSILVGGSNVIAILLTHYLSGVNCGDCGTTGMMTIVISKKVMLALFSSDPNGSSTINSRRFV